MPKLADPPAVPRRSELGRANRDRTAPPPNAAPGPFERDVSVANGTPCSEREYLHRFHAPHGAEYVDGRIDYLPVASSIHQRVNKFLFLLVHGYLTATRPNADVQYNGQPVRVPDPRGGSRFRHPDVVALLEGSSPLALATHWDGADLCVEVVSPDDPPRDLVEKRGGYAAAGIPEYWIVDPRDGVRTVTVLSLVGGSYEGEPRGDGEAAESVLLPGLRFDVTECLDAR